MAKGKPFRAKEIDCEQKLEQKLKSFILSVFKICVYSMV